MVLVILMLNLATALPWARGAIGAERSARTLLPEATVLSAVDGRVVHVDANDTWLFELAADVNRVDVNVPAGTRFPLLPSAVLERLIADVNERSVPTYRLSVRVTQYEGKNFLFPTYFLPLSKLKDASAPPDTAEPAEADVGQVDPDLPVPEAVLEKFASHRPIRGPRREPTDSEPASPVLGRMLVNRVGMIEAERERLTFIPYALGWNIGDIRYELLPCHALEQAIRMQEQTVEPIRFNVVGLVAEFKGGTFLLLQRAIPVYNYDNFGR